MTTEAVVTKLGYLGGRGLRGAELRDAMVSDLRGEVTLADHEGKTLTQMISLRRSRL